MGNMIAPEDIRTFYPYECSYIDRTGNVAINAGKYQRVGSFSGGLAAVWLVNDGWGFIDKTGKIIIEPQFEQALSFAEGLAGVQIEGLWGFIDRKGDLVIEPQYELVNNFSEGISIVVRGAPKEAPRPPSKGHSLQVESIRREVVTLIDIPMNDRPADLAQHLTKEVLLIDRTGQTILSRDLGELQLSIYENGRCSEGLIDAYDCGKKKIGFIDKTGRFVIEPRYGEAAPFSEGLARVAVAEDGEEKIGFIDHHGQFVIPPKFNTDFDFRRNSTDFSDGLASLSEGLRPTLTEESKFVYIDKEGTIVLFTGFFYAGSFRDGMATVYDSDT
ncbi:MAG: WG repeat-containing protein, partial [Pyrinomonadaceae bacterium]|nr:WG repeat-containing protein [Pyrinomonadaceae bacterium]